MNENESTADVSSKGSIPSLTPTETAILTSMSTGKTNKQLAELHGISINTIKFHLHNIFEKLAVPNRKQAVARYRELNDSSGSD